MLRSGRRMGPAKQIIVAGEHHTYHRKEEVETQTDSLTPIIIAASLTCLAFQTLASSTARIEVLLAEEIGAVNRLILGNISSRIRTCAMGTATVGRASGIPTGADECLSSPN